MKLAANLFVYLFMVAVIVAIGVPHYGPSVRPQLERCKSQQLQLEKQLAQNPEKAKQLPLGTNLQNEHFKTIDLPIPKGARDWETMLTIVQMQPEPMVKCMVHGSAKEIDEKFAFQATTWGMISSKISGFTITMLICFHVIIFFGLVRTGKEKDSD